jgi:hypothetical protein
MRKTMKVAGALAFIALCAGCATTQVGVTAKRAQVAAYDAETGKINTPSYELCDLVAMNPDTKIAWRVAQIPFKATEVSYGKPADGTVQSFGAPFELSFSTKVPDQTKSEVNEFVNVNTNLHVEKTWTRSLRTPEAFVLAHDEILKKMKSVQEQDPQAKFFFVTGVTSADRVYFTFGDATAKNSLKMDHYQFNFKYDQNSDLDRLAKSKAAFFTMMPLTLANDSDGREVVAIDGTFEEKLPQYSFADTQQAW